MVMMTLEKEIKDLKKEEMLNSNFIPGIFVLLREKISV